MTELSTVSRRRLLKAGAAAAAVGVASPWIMRSAMASSGVLNFMGWAGYDDLPKVFAAFEKKTGIKVNFTGFGNQDEMLAAAKAGGAANGSFDIVEPTADRVSNWVENDYLQPWDDKKANLDGVEPAFLQGGAAAQAVIGGKRYGLTSVWGSESLTFNTKEAPLAFGTASLMDLFDDKYAGKLTLRGHSGLVAAGRALEAAGRLPHKFND
ncbi:MAG: extracellular solute-binding protein, partial [Burkholderiales bacterium]|nr:extracellular solute-binding protein [Burkholderiales bacterium]